MILQTALFCLSLNVYFEARGEPESGQLAVAHVTINRSKQNGTQVCHEVFKKNQFSWTQNHRYKVPSGDEWESAQRVAKLALNSKDTTKGSTFFFNPKKCGRQTSITSGRRKTGTIGNHVFYADYK